MPLKMVLCWQQAGWHWITRKPCLNAVAPRAAEMLDAKPQRSQGNVQRHGNGAHLDAEAGIICAEADVTCCDHVHPCSDARTCTALTSIWALL